MLEHLVGYTDTVTTDKNVLSAKRKRINIVAHITVFMFFVAYIMSFTFYTMNYFYTGIIVMILASIMLLLALVLIIKREIYSIMIYLKVRE